MLPVKTVFFYIFLVATAATATSEQFVENDLIRRANCGGSTTGDSSSLIFPVSPDGDSLIPGESCIWTVHLETTRSFRFTLTNYSDNSTDLDCSDAGIRIYSLTNLVPGDKLQSYTFCSAKLPPDNFFLNENVAAVVLFVSENSSVKSVQFSQFNLTWEGSSFDPLETKHLASFSNSLNGVIRYPIIGQYESSVAATWVIDSQSTQNQIVRTDFLLERLGLQSCTNADPCLCDALILYVITESGLLEEKQRFCSDSTDISLQGVESKFILGFFTDFQAQSDTGTGFQVIYYPSEVATTTEVTSTTLDPGNTRCGEVFTGRFGNITYKETVDYAPNERCIWILRVPGAMRYDFSFITIGYGGERGDGIAILTLDRDSNPLNSYDQVWEATKYQLNGNIAIIMFYSDHVSHHNGVFFTYEAIIPGNDISEDSTDVFLSGFPTDTIRHPNQNLFYSKQELSTFTVIPEFKNPPGSIINSTFSLYGLDTTGCNCCDYLAVLLFHSNAEDGTWWSYIDQLCASSSNITIQHSDVLLVAFVSDGSSEGRGFEISSVVVN